MSAIVVVGSQWGDEGKGKITDFLRKLIAWFVIRAAMPDTLWGDQQFKLHIPSGILSIPCIVAYGVAVDMVELIKELD